MKLEAECKTVHIGNLEVIDNPESLHPRIKFYGIADDLVTNTGKTVTLEKDSWCHQLDATNALVTFFEALTLLHPDVAESLMKKHGITYREDDDTP